MSSACAALPMRCAISKTVSESLALAVQAEIERQLSR